MYFSNSCISYESLYKFTQELAVEYRCLRAARRIVAQTKNKSRNERWNEAENRGNVENSSGEFAASAIVVGWLRSRDLKQLRDTHDGKLDFVARLRLVFVGESHGALFV